MWTYCVFVIVAMSTSVSFWTLYPIKEVIKTIVHHEYLTVSVNFFLPSRWIQKIENKHYILFVSSVLLKPILWYNLSLIFMIFLYFWGKEYSKFMKCDWCSQQVKCNICLRSMPSKHMLTFNKKNKKKTTKVYRC